ncbi:hypothetical protein NDU88_009772 [Pleurodeles waltl]|uniref:Uncharacterized protein n=1 Tax=Pleurodeles waltl TaxID=8319 RepID=A0AAV7RZC2_PLEWA|nr:hypothetical protein NDU88_009772 [Pleurodeles waltl]
MLPGCRAAEALGIATFAFGEHKEGVSHILEEFPTVFKGNGCLKGKDIPLHIDQSVKPVAKRHRQIAFHLMPQVEKALGKLEPAGIIEKVSGPTLWVSPIVVTQKPKQHGEVRICLDDAATQCHPKSGYHQLTLTEEWRYITTFSTHVGLRH